MSSLAMDWIGTIVYADNIQLFFIFDREERDEALHHFEICT